MLGEIQNVRWNLEIQPPWNKEGVVVEALRALALAVPETGERAYSHLLYALGNNHAGTYFPVALAAVPFLGEILRDGGPTARARTLDVLIDLIGSFEPDPAFQLVATSVGPRPLKDLLIEKALGLADDVERCCSAPASPEESKLAHDLLVLLRDPNPA